MKFESKLIHGGQVHLCHKGSAKDISGWPLSYYVCLHIYLFVYIFTHKFASNKLARTELKQIRFIILI